MMNSTYINRSEWQTRPVSWVICDVLIVQLSRFLLLCTSLLWFSLTFQRHRLVRWGGGSKLPKNMNAGISHNKWTRRENVWTSETKTARCLWTPYPPEETFNSAPPAQIYRLSLQNKGAIVPYYILLSAQQTTCFFQGLFSKSPPQLRHTLEHNSLRLKIAPCEVTPSLVNRKEHSPWTGDNGRWVLRWLICILQADVHVFRRQTLRLSRKQRAS